MLAQAKRAQQALKPQLARVQEALPQRARVPLQALQLEEVQMQVQMQLLAVLVPARQSETTCLAQPPLQAKALSVQGQRAPRQERACRLRLPLVPWAHLPLPSSPRQRL